MGTMKRIGSLLLAFTLVVTPAIINAKDVDNNMDKDLINEDMHLIDEGVNAVEIKEYITYEGHIIDVNDKDGNISIWVQGEEGKENSQEGVIFHIDESVLLLSDDTMEGIAKEHLKKDMEVLVFYGGNTPMALSLPPQATPNGVVVRVNEELNFLKVSNFNDELTSLDNTLKLNIQEDTPIVNEDGEKVDKEDLIGENLLVFYDNTTRSIPAQTNPNKVILLETLDVDTELRLFDIISIGMVEDTKQTKVLDNHIYKNEDGIIMVPLREIGEALGYKVSWDGQRWAAQLTKNAQWTEVIIGEDNYNFAKMIVKLGTAPVLKDSTTYVPINFIEEVLQMNLNIQDGMLKITE